MNEVSSLPLQLFGVWGGGRVGGGHLAQTSHSDLLVGAALKEQTEPEVRAASPEEVTFELSLRG